MKVIISHDIDHITATEHLFSDLIIPKHIVRTNIEFAAGKISVSEYFNRFQELLKNKLHNVDELVKYNVSSHIPATFFIGVNKGIGLNYSNSKATLLGQKIIEANLDLAIHGIAYDSKSLITEEVNLFNTLFKQQPIGNRMHYVRVNSNTLNYLSEVGYKYDSTIFSFKNPYKIGEMWEFPFQIMDGWIIENGKRRQSRNLNECKEATLRIIESAHEKKLEYLGIDFHDRYFSKSFATWMNWYVWLTDYLKKSNLEFISFNNAVKELDAK